jgi:F-type H+-transporting ATPase subunit b
MRRTRGATNSWRTPAARRRTSSRKASAARQLLEEARSEAEAEKARIVKDGYSEVEQQRNAVAAELRGQVADLVVEGAEKILSAEVDRSRHEDLLRALSSRI